MKVQFFTFSVWSSSAPQHLPTMLKQLQHRKYLATPWSLFVELNICTSKSSWIFFPHSPQPSDWVKMWSIEPKLFVYLQIVTMWWDGPSNSHKSLIQLRFSAECFYSHFTHPKYGKHKINSAGHILTWHPSIRHIVEI